ncbi:MAG: class I SAM-dependent methyltransferase [Bacilli bacterium]|nr:class I SAM-dependent methyltransferase [Bacilli bacterium]
MNISKRLETIGKLVPENKKIVDIGCDHALLSIYIYLYKFPLKVIASDININALKQGKLNIKKYNLDNKIITKVGNGLETIKNEDIDTIIISGLGSKKIIDILNNDISLLKNVEYILVQPNNNVYQLRKAITQMGFYIETEKLIKENKIIYTIILFKKGIKKYNKNELYFGPILFNTYNKLFLELYNQKIKKYTKIYNKIPSIYLKQKLYYKYKIRFINKNISIYKKRNQ